jgi:uncharacterized protein YyaL (SSP411 family)
MVQPGSNPYSSSLQKRLRAAFQAKGEKYKPRTHHLGKNGSPTFINRLIMETSPYLLQHAHNPVDWFPWGDEAFALAKKLKRPVLLSVGYSTCHWCHVMEKESFEDIEIATYINEHFIAIKVDREERPDVDSVYMTTIHLMRGRGGWPMTVVMTPDRQPFFGGTYFPARDGDRGSRLGFLSILKQLSESYSKDPAAMLRKASKITQRLQQASQPRPPTNMPGPATLVESAQRFYQRYDKQYGGFGRAPKFPRPSVYELLLRYWRRTQDPTALNMVAHSLDMMMDGGIYDHLAGGFHRYSTDREWLAPHFEKMLYDNAQLAVILVQVYQATGQDRYARVAKETLDYVAREMTSPEGGFYSATDADSEGHEGTFFLWTPSQLTGILGAEAANRFALAYDVTNQGNFEHKNILRRLKPFAAVVKELKTDPATLRAELKASKAKLYAAREDREHPILDDKIIAEWNGQMISAFSQAALAFDKQSYLVQAKNAAQFILDKMQKDGRLFRTFRAGQAKHMGVLEDYAFVIEGLLDLFEADQDLKWLTHAIKLQSTVQKYFFDEKNGAFFTTADDGEKLLVREKETYDGAQPAGNSVTLRNLLRLAEYTQDETYQAVAEQSLVALSAGLERGGLGSPKLATALEFMLDEPKEIIVIGNKNSPTKPLLDVIAKTYLPNRILVVSDESNLKTLQASIPLVEGKKAMSNKATAYVCTGRVCLKPTSDPKELAKQLARVEPLSKDIPPLQQ